MKVLFFGDSITDMCRFREVNNPATALGMGYVFFDTAYLKELDTTIEIINRGCGGDKITNLFDRYNEDVIAHKPDVLSILIGVNDVWHKIAVNNGTSLPKFKKTYKAMLDDIKAKLPNTKLIIMEPFILHGCATDEAWERFEEVYKYAKAVKRIAKEYDALFIPLQKIMDKAAIKYGSDNVLYDGVHPHALGAKVIADAWIKAYKKL